MTYTLLSCIDSKKITSTKFYGKFELGVFSPGQALTVANALRRSLLSELSGTAIVLIQIIGASHEYDTLYGVRECVLDILLNFKKIILQSDFDNYEPQVGFLSAQGPGIVRAYDLKLPFFISSIDPDQYIATLATDGQLNIKFLIACGKTYLNFTINSKQYFTWIELLQKVKPIFLNSLKFKQNKLSSVNNYQNWKKQKLILQQLNYFPNVIRLNLLNIKNISHIKLKKKNLIFSNKFKQLEKIKTSTSSFFPVDSIFAPILRANYTIELKNNLKNKEIIFFEIWTNGTIDPRFAIHKTSKILIQLLLPLQKIKKSILNNQNFFYLLKSKKKFKKLNKTIFYSKYRLNFKSNHTTTFTLIQKLKKINCTKLTNKNNTTFVINQIKLNKNFKSKFLKLDLVNLNLPFDVYRILKKNNINTIGELILKSTDQLLEIVTFNKNTLLKIKTNFKKFSNYF